MSEHASTAITECPLGHDCCSYATADARAFAAVVDDLRSAIAAAHTSIPGGRKGDKARGILRRAMDRSTNALWQIRLSENGSKRDAG